MKVILGSQSEGRRKVLQSMGYQFEVMSADIDEKAIRYSSPYDLTLALATAKADALLPRIQKEAILVTSDQVVSWKGEIREKPTNEDEARNFLRSYCVYPAETVTAVVAVNTVTKERREGVDVARVWFRMIPEDVIAEIVEEGKVFSSAGGFSVEDSKLEKYIARFDGAVDSIIGLPIELTAQLINQTYGYGEAAALRELDSTPGSSC